MGFAVMLFVVPLTGVTAGRLFKLRRGLVGLADKRVNLVSECINGIRVLKFYAWERNFAERITAIRADELGELWKINKLSALFSVLLFSAPVLIAVAAIGSYSLTGAPLTASRLYTALSVFNIIRFPLVFLPFILSARPRASCCVTNSPAASLSLGVERKSGARAAHRVSAGGGGGGREKRRRRGDQAGRYPRVRWHLPLRGGAPQERGPRRRQGSVGDRGGGRQGGGQGRPGGARAVRVTGRCGRGAEWQGGPR